MSSKLLFILNISLLSLLLFCLPTIRIIVVLESERSIISSRYYTSTHIITYYNVYIKTKNNVRNFSGTKYHTDLKDNAYKTHMKLTIISVTLSDYGTYQCVSKNSLGETDGTIKLYGMQINIYTYTLDYNHHFLLRKEKCMHTKRTYTSI